MRFLFKQDETIGYFCSMKMLFLIGFLIAASVSCRDKTKAPVTPVHYPASSDSAAKDENYFPVTNYLKGEIAGIKTIGITPVKKHLRGDVVLDSSWIQEADYTAEFAPFLNPVIDSANLKKLFTEKKFLDQTVDAYTFTYDPAGTLPDSLPLLHWDVYIQPETGKVKRIFITKKYGTDELQQLTWQSGKWCKIVTIKNKDNKPVITSEIKIDWSL